MERNLRLVLAYDGRDFHGWQRQAGVRTVQEELEQILMRLLRHPLTLSGASRTDAGVHARGQVANLLTTSPIPLEKFGRALADRLPPDIALRHAALAPPAFRASRDARSKLYRYRLLPAGQAAAAQLRSAFVWPVRYPLDVDRLRRAAARLVGRHDFAGFASQGSPRATTVRTIFRVDVARRYDELLVDVEGDGFLYNQVRNMVGTLVEIARGHWAVERVDEVLASRDRALAGPTAPPQGLCLQWVRYAPETLNSPENAAAAESADGA